MTNSVESQRALGYLANFFLISLKFQLLPLCNRDNECGGGGGEEGSLVYKVLRIVPSLLILNNYQLYSSLHIKTNYSLLNKNSQRIDIALEVVKVSTELNLKALIQSRMKEKL